MREPDRRTASVGVQSASRAPRAGEERTSRAERFLQKRPQPFPHKDSSARGPERGRQGGRTVRCSGGPLPWPRALRGPSEQGRTRACTGRRGRPLTHLRERPGASQLALGEQRENTMEKHSDIRNILAEDLFEKNHLESRTREGRGGRGKTGELGACQGCLTEPQRTQRQRTGPRAGNAQNSPQG